MSLVTDRYASVLSKFKEAGYRVENSDWLVDLPKELSGKPYTLVCASDPSLAKEDIEKILSGKPRRVAVIDTYQRNVASLLTLE